MKKSVEKTAKQLRQEAMERMREEALQKEQAASEPAVSHWDKLVVGANIRRFLPLDIKSRDENFFARQRGEHRRRNRFLHVCITEEFDARNGNPKPGTLCRTCKRFLRQLAVINGQYERFSQEAKDAYKEICQKYKPQTKFYSLVYRPAENDIKLLSYGIKIYEQLEKILTEDGDFTDPDDGRALRIVKKDLGGGKENVSYTVNKNPPEALDGFDTWEVPSIDDLLGAKPTPDDIDAIYARIEESERLQKEAVAEEAGETISENQPEPAGTIEYPTCFGDPDIHSPKDPACLGCALFEECKAQPQIIAKAQRQRPPERTATLANTRAKLTAKAK